MTLVNWSPFREFEDLFDRYNRVFSRSLPTTGDSEEGAVVQWRPAANISETKDEYLIKAELPEVEKKDVEVTVHDGVITIRGERRFERTDDSERQHRVESFYGKFERSFSLPADADESKIYAESKDGVLKVRIPKTEVMKPKAVEIKVR
ncbi:MAG: Hsp20/alpha crystallin family protein [Gammaproteobacteria bacterium]|nr:Hsp20/alpha crystallin family protein [Gammaproteobacteria bacterium]